MEIRTFPVGALGCNCSVIADEATKLAIVVDPGGDFEAIQAALSADALTVKAIVHTHTHIDHVGATAPLQSWSGAEAHIHEADRFLYAMLGVQAALLGIPEPPSCDVLGTLEDGFTLRAGSVELAVMHTPGHTPGSVSFVVGAGDQQIVFSGDTLFRGGIGRTDLWGGDHRLIEKSLKERLLALDDATTVIPGHGPRTRIGIERRANPFLLDL